MSTSPFSTLHFTTTTASGRPMPEQDQRRKRALVLGGGGSSGNAWVIGVLAGLSDGGLDPAEADLVVGTSSGSTAAAQLAGATPAELLAGVLAAAPPQRPASAGGGGSVRPAIDHLARTGALIAAAEGPADMRRRLGAAALDLAAASDGSAQPRWRATVAARLPGAQWPDRTMLIPAVDARTGEPVVFDRTSGVDLVDAVAASCSSGVPYRIGDSWFIDGGYRRASENADLAAGCERVLVLSPFGGRARTPLGWRMHLAAQVDDLRAGGSSVETIVPGDASLEAFGDDMTDLSRRPLAARAGYGQGRARAEQLRSFWN